MPSISNAASLIVLHDGDCSSVRGGPLCCGLISIDCEIGPAAGRTHV